MFLKCCKCGRQDEWVMASVDLDAGICINCSDLFDEWCDSHPTEPFQNFIQPKPWYVRKARNGLLNLKVQEIDGAIEERARKMFGL